jgi:hypothetical protein
MRQFAKNVKIFLVILALAAAGAVIYAAVAAAIFLIVPIAIIAGLWFVAKVFAYEDPDDKPP